MDVPVIDGLFVFVLGLLVVFLGMIIIVLAVSLFGKIFSAKKEDTKKPKTEVQPIKEEVKSEEEIPAHVKAAIVAAISAYYFSANSKCDFVVKKIKRY